MTEGHTCKTNLWKKRADNACCLQLMARLKNDILAGVYPSGARIPSEQLCARTA